ncbi:MAG: KamA family radical SAM protein [Deltaproteobacteria bacterium]|jgi:lysine 2,3-aminomutase|nr:KamA family radical SAM protein [Deltaproteobacteria bacterium]
MPVNITATNSNNSNTLTQITEDDQPPGYLKTDFNNLPISDTINDFRKKFFPDITLSNWNDWRWQIKNRLSTAEEFQKIISLSDDEKLAFAQNKGIPIAVTPYYLALIYNSQSSLRRCMLPSMAEFYQAPGEKEDPLSEENHSPIHGLVHRYNDRALFMATDFCSCYCRYCTRSRLVGGGRKSAQAKALKMRWELAINWIAEHPEIKDVILSGGDPLTLTDSQIEFLLERIRTIKHVEIIRIGTKMPVVLPQRITKPLLKILKKFHPLFVSIHFTHPDELTLENKITCERLADAGIPLGSQTVLLNGINNNLETLSSLMTGLLKHRVRPYYIYQCDPIIGSAHFRTNVKHSVELIGSLQGNISGYAVPNYVVDTPGGGGKISLLPNRIVSIDENGLCLQNYEHSKFYYPEFE